MVKHMTAEFPVLTSTEYPITKIHCVLASKMTPGVLRAQEKSGRQCHGLIYVLSGNCTYYCENDTVLRVSPKDILYLAKDSHYTMKVESDYSVIFINFDLQTDGILLYNAVYSSVVLNMEKRFFQMYKIWTRQSPAMYSQCFSMLYGIYADLIQAGCSEYVDSKSMESKLLPAKNYILENYMHENISLKKMAELCNMSVIHFRRLFTQSNGIPPTKYIRMLRMERAKEMLSFGNSKIADIAEKAGYPNTYYFCRCFKEETGITAEEYRKNYRATGRP